MYAIQAQAVINGTMSVQIATFYLDENVQGITDEFHARVIAESILRNTHLSPIDHDCTLDTVYHISAVKVS